MSELRDPMQDLPVKLFTMFLRNRFLSLLVSGVTLLSVPFFLSACGKKQATTDCEQIQVRSGKRDLTVGYIAPTSGIFGIGDESLLVVYLHGLGANWQQPFSLPWRHTYADTVTHFKPGITFMSTQFGAGGKWADEDSSNDITNSINAILKKYPSRDIVLCGCSMGASTALSYAATAPEEIRRKIIGVIAMYPAGDFVELHEKTTTALVRSALEQCFGGPPDTEEIKQRYLDMSIMPKIEKFPKQTRVYMMSAKADATIPPPLQKSLAEALKKQGVKVELEEIDCGHELPPSHKSFAKGLNFVLTKE
ncbi:alpha/beta hydrolase fold domain-containing protein [Candidatus Obscuribacterales bacterium]|nr:alpha/beta hydrolase fold domain-containing protein [Candidatus Obscuribacterales bacterium]